MNVYIYNLLIKCDLKNPVIYVSWNFQKALILSWFNLKYKHFVSRDAKVIRKKQTHYDVIIECLHKISVQKLIFYLNKKTKTQKTITKWL